jgi:hypothetical protein
MAAAQAPPTFPAPMMNILGIFIGISRAGAAAPQVFYRLETPACCVPLARQARR